MEGDGVTTEEDFVTVATFRDLLEASVTTGALEAAGIPALVPQETIGTFSRLPSSQTGWVELKVREGDRVRALKLLSKAGHR